MGPSGQTVPPVSSLRRAGSLNITWPCASCGGGIGTQECYAARYRRLPSAAASCAPICRHPARQPRRYRLGQFVAGGARYARGDMSSRGGRASGATQRRAMAPFQVLPAIARRLLCAHTPHGWAGYASWRHATNGARPLWMPATSVTRRKQLVVSCRQVIQRLAVVAARRHLAARRAT